MTRRRRVRRYRRQRRLTLQPKGLVQRVERLRQPEPTGSLSPVTPLSPPKRTVGSEDGSGARMGLRLTVGAVVVVSLFAVLAVRLWTLQVIDGPQLNSAARQLAVKDIELIPTRGEIFDRGGTPADVVAGDRPEWIVTLEKNTATVDPGVIDTLAALLNTTSTAIVTTLKTNQYSQYAPIPIAINVDPSTILYIQEHPGMFPGVTATQAYERTYPYNDLASQALGYVGAVTAKELPALSRYGYTPQDQVGQSGLEAQYELQLRGTPGRQEVEVDPFGNVVSRLSSTPAVPGDNLYLNLDLGLETFTADALANQIAALRAGLVAQTAVPADFGAAVVLDAQTGAVLAMTSYPTYNANLWVPFITEAEYSALVHAPGDPLQNYAIDGPQTPGSTFKLITATAGLDDGLISAGYYYDDTGTFTIGKPPTVLHDNELTGLGYVNVSSALTESSDAFFYNLGALFCQQNVGCPTGIQQMAAKYGLGEDPGVDLPGASSGQVDSPQLRESQHAADPAAFPYPQYYQGDNVETAFGQGETLVSPLQLAEAYATFANGGTRYAPELAAALVSPSGKVRKIAPKVLSRVPLPASTYDPVLTGLQGTVQDSKGTAYGPFQGFNFSAWDVAGKTGTATSANGVQPVSWFVAFGGPRNAAPKYVAAVEIDQGGYGAAASAPVVREIFNYLYQHGVAPLHT